jgi:TOBE domain
MGEGAVAPHLWTCFCCRAAYNILPQPRVLNSVQGSGGRPRRQREPTSQEAAVTLHGIVDKSEARFRTAARIAAGRPHPRAVDFGRRWRSDSAFAFSRATSAWRASYPVEVRFSTYCRVQIVATNALDAYEVLAAVALGEEGAGARLLARVPQKSWQELGFAKGQSVWAQVKSVAFGRADVRE